MTEKTEINDLLHKIQQVLNVPKSRKAKHYSYRSCEDILDAVKKLLPEGATILLTDEIIYTGNRFYIKAQACLRFKSECTCAYGWAREPETKPGMDESQITGAASSYARKYALNGLFCIDDIQDADAQNDITIAKPQEPQSIFATSEMRDTWKQNVMKAFDDQPTVKQLIDTAQLYKAKLEQMQANPQDLKARNEVNEYFKKRKADIEAKPETYLNDEIPF